MFSIRVSIKIAAFMLTLTDVEKGVRKLWFIHFGLEVGSQI
jgi:hypothetical protein